MTDYLPIPRYLRYLKYLKLSYRSLRYLQQLLHGQPLSDSTPPNFLSIFCCPGPFSLAPTRSNNTTQSVFHDTSRNKTKQHQLPRDMSTSAPAAGQPIDRPVVTNGLPNGTSGADASSNGSVVNGTSPSSTAVNGHRPHTPSLSGLSLTEYSANPSPPSEDKRARLRQTIPDEFVLPSGYPDVCPQYIMYTPLLCLLFSR